MYKRRTLKNGNTKLENSRRTRYAIFDRKKNKVTFVAGVSQFVVREFEKDMQR